MAEPGADRVELADLILRLRQANVTDRRVVAAIEAFDDSTEIDDHLGRHDEASLTRQRVSMLRANCSQT